MYGTIVTQSCDTNPNTTAVPTFHEKLRDIMLGDYLDGVVYFDDRVYKKYDEFKTWLEGEIENDKRVIE